MTLIGWVQAALVFAVVWLAVKPLGTYMARVFTGERTWLAPVLAPIERGIYRICRIDPERETGWKQYAFAVLAFSFVGLVYLYALLRTQAWRGLVSVERQTICPFAGLTTASIDCCQRVVIRSSVNSVSARVWP